MLKGTTVLKYLCFLGICRTSASLTGHPLVFALGYHIQRGSKKTETRTSEYLIPYVQYLSVAKEPPPAQLKCQ